MLRSNALTIKESNATTFLVLFLGLFLEPFQSSSRLPLVVLSVETVVTGLANVQWLANGLKLAGQMLPGLGFAILLRYLPVRRNLHYLALGLA